MPGDESGWSDGAAGGSGEPPDVGPLAEEFAQLTVNLLNAGSVADVLEHVVLAAHRVIPGADLVSVTLRSSDGVFHTPVETDVIATKLDQLQYETQEGPCLEAARPDGPAEAHSDDLATEPAWPRFGPAAAAQGVRAVLSVALLPDARPPRYGGALNIYSRCPGAIGVTAHESALLLATHASLALAGTAGLTRAELRSENLHKAIASRDVIGQAKGILMARRGVSAEEAFDQLRRASQELNMKLVDVAHLLASRHTEFELPAE